MAMTGEKFVEVAGIRTRYFEKGKGEPMVLVHGADFGAVSADCADDWDLNFDGLAESFHVFAFDKLGQGYTDNPKSDSDYTITAQAEHAYRFIEKLGIEGAHLLGHSRGGYLVARLTLLHPERVKTCTVIDSNTLAPGTGRNEIVHANPPRPLFSRESLRWVLERYCYNPHCVTDDWLDVMTDVAAQPKYRKTVEKMSDQGLRSTLFNPALQREKEETLARLAERGMERPTLLFWGYNDPTATMDQGLVLFDLLAAKERRTTLQVFNQAGHFVYREHPQAFNEAVSAFIRSC